MNSPTDLLEPKNREKQALTGLLDRYLAKDDLLLVQKTQMGSTEAFIGSVTLEWLDRWVKFASDLPLFREKLDPQTKNTIRDIETIEEIQQRPLDWSRQAPLTQYLVTRKTHKFPAVLVVISPDWVDDPEAPEWDKRGRSRKNAIDFTSLDSQETVGFLKLKDVSIFALDGQHRLMGIQGLMTLLKTGQFQPVNKMKKNVGPAITIEEIMEKSEIESEELYKLVNESIGIEFIPAVVKGETRAEARKRIRSIFVHVNLSAVKLSQGQLTLLNEDDGFSIIARKVAVTHPLLKSINGRHPRIDWDSPTVANNSTVLTTLQALKEMSERYLIHKYPTWKPADKNLIPIRPSNKQLEEGLEKFSELFDHLADLPSYYRLRFGTETPDMRRFSFEKKGGEGNILFRPVGQVALAQALGILVFKKRLPIADVFNKLSKYDADDGFSGIDSPKSLWYGIFFDPNKKRILVSGQELASELIVYLLGGMKNDVEIAELRLKVAEARTIEGKAVGFNGKFVQPKQVGLPKILS